MRRNVIIFLVLVGILLAAGTALAEKEEGVETIAWGDAIFVKIDTGGDTMDVTYDVQVTEGARVNVYYVPEKGYKEYNDESETTFSYAPAYTNLNTKSAKESFTETEGGVWYVIIENGDMSAIGDNSTVDYEVTWEPLSLGDWMTYIGICAVVIIVVIVALVFVMKGRKKKAAEAMPPPQPYPQQPYQDTSHLQQMPGSAPEPSPSDMGPGYIPPETGYEGPPEQPQAPPQAPPQEPPQY